MNKLEIYDKFCRSFFNFKYYAGNSISNYYINTQKSYFSVFNKYVPSYSIFNRNVLGNKDVIEYFEIRNGDGNTTRSYEILINNLRSDIYSPRTFIVSKGDFKSILTANQGILLDEDGVLFCLCIEKELMAKLFQVYSNNHKTLVDSFDVNDFKIFISNRIKEPHYKSLYTVLDRVLLEKAREIDLDYTFTNSIESKIYNGIPSDFINPKFKTVAEMKSFLENYLPSLI